MKTKITEHIKLCMSSHCSKNCEFYSEDVFGNVLCLMTVKEDKEISDWLLRAEDALGKQIPKKVDMSKDTSDTYSFSRKVSTCPACGEPFIRDDETRYCYICGQKLDWGDDE